MADPRRTEEQRKLSHGFGFQPKETCTRKKQMQRLGARKISLVSVRRHKTATNLMNTLSASQIQTPVIAGKKGKTQPLQQDEPMA
ncbi:MAG: hypothetical protein WB762_11845 [Candidatus Sulfotelmatobacter sp.]